ncbi:uncharacterized protein LOC110048990 isoform X2 [Orbicella faveolata]|uniref:uncharacterized protein LOC110048990 isoform X1 n=1 Tax=Orbicella faveolata TaxID=48498 RepID=UPI0009E62723|nr:uncharacterized protein LOC110048990 isoform X1 [Orbicella faveolata]XP_020610416.1 uncharacterized protein LOC110048990 isoform X2 [Orbicella faveolata]
MEEEHRNILIRRRTAITNDLEVKKVLNKLTVLGDEDRDEIKAERTRTEQARALLDMLPRKGSNAFTDFVSVLYEVKGQEHLADLLRKDSGIEIPTNSKDDVGMTSQHRQILRRNVDSLHRIDLDKLVAHLSALLDDEDKQNLRNTAKPAYERVDMLLTEVLPRRGPTAFHSFVQGLEKVDPSIAQSLQQEAGMKGSSNGETSPGKMPVQDTGSYSLDSPVQDILDERPEMLKRFREEMDVENVLGNGWKRFYKELGLPDGRETSFEGREGGPTLNVIKGWISQQGRNATVQALLSAVNRSERKDCSHLLEKSLGCQLDRVDSPIGNVTKKMGSLSTGLREVNFFGDLNDSQATVIANNLGHDAEELLRTELGRGLNDSNISTKELILRSTSYPIRKYTNSLADGYRGQAIKTLREALGTSKGVVGE